jgi:hypothetical protein
MQSQPAQSSPATEFIPKPNELMVLGHPS